VQIHSFLVPGTQATTAPSSGSAASSPIQDTNNMFMQLLTAQLKNQSPLDPVDPMQFTTQLVQFNMLDQLAQIRALLQQTAAPVTATPNAKISGGH
jgi:flagellar basal-body rod modification protein FlgD